MKTRNLCIVIMAAGISLYTCTSTSQTTAQQKLVLHDNWTIQSSREVSGDGKIISTPSWQPEKWYPASVPSTVLGTLVEDKVYPDPYFGTNIEKIPGYFSRRGGEIPENSPFKASWWYRTTFMLPAEFKGQNTWIKFHSINYKANIWLNGHLVADTSEIEGAYRLYNLNITPVCPCR